MLDYIELDYKPGKDELIVEYRLEPNRISLKEACEQIAGESSIGTWTDIATMKPEIAKRLKPHVFSIDNKTKDVKIAYPAELFEAGNMPQILSSIGGNIFGMRAIRGLRLQDISFPWKIMRKFHGPRFGVDGIRKLMRVNNRPFVGTIIKPKVGLNEEEHASVAYQAWTGGIDIVKDDENLSSMSFNDFNLRIKETLRLRDKAERETGEKKIYMPNVTAETEKMLRRAEFVKHHGGEYVMIDIITAGWSALQTLRQANLGLVIHAHRAGHGMFTENPKHGMSMLAVAKIARLIGVDQIHVGAIFGKMKGGKGEVKLIGEEIERKIVHHDKSGHILEQKWYNVKPVFAVCSGGLHPGAVPSLVKAMGKNIIIQAGGGVHGHPDGTFFGAKAMRQAVDAAVKGISLREYAKENIELEKAVNLWGVV